MSRDDRTVERLDRGAWGAAVALGLAGAGVAVGSRTLVAAATIPLCFVAAAALGTRPESAVRLARSISRRDPSDDPVVDGDGSEDDATVSGDPGEVLGVRTTVRNVGEEPAVDLRVVDGVPDALPVVAGSARACLTLDPGEAATIEYGIELRRGDHDFEEATVRSRDVTGAVVETWTADAAGDGTVTCVPTASEVPIGGGTDDYAGEVPTDEGGTGVEFHSVRDYEPGDPVGSIDWRRYANTRELSTVQFRAERSSRIVCVIDARPSQFREASNSHLTGAELSAEAAERVFERLVRAGQPTGVVGLYESDLSVVSPGTGAETRRRAADVIREAARSSEPTSTLSWRRRGIPAAELLGSVPGEAQIYLFSSFLDDEPLELVRRLRADGYPVRVVSPDVTGSAEGGGARLAALARRTRLARARWTGSRVVDWHLDRPLEVVLRRAVGEVSAR